MIGLNLPAPGVCRLLFFHSFQLITNWFFHLQWKLYHNRGQKPHSASLCGKCINTFICKMPGFLHSDNEKENIPNYNKILKHVCAMVAFTADSQCYTIFEINNNKRRLQCLPCQGVVSCLGLVHCIGYNLI